MRQFLLIALIIVQSTVLLAQKVVNNDLVVAGSVVVKEKYLFSALDSVKLLVIVDGERVQELNLEKKGRFEIVLELEGEYILKFTRPGYHSKTLFVETAVDPAAENREFGYTYTRFNVKLEKKRAMDETDTNFWVGKIYFEPSKGVFIHTMFETAPE